MLINHSRRPDGSHRKRSQRKRSHKSHRNTRRRMGGIHQMFQYNKKSKNGRIAKSSVGKLRRSQKGGHEYKVTSIDRTRGIHLLKFLKEYDNESEIIGPTFADCTIRYKGISEKDAQVIREYLHVTYADRARIIETPLKGKGESTFDIISNNESKACFTDFTDINIAEKAIHSLNYSQNVVTNYSYVVKTNATDALRYYLTSNLKLGDLSINGLTRLDVKPPKQ